MKIEKVTIVRIYLKESKDKIKTIIDFLQDEVKIRGYSIFKTADSFGDHKKESMFWWDDLSVNLPLVIEFFDQEAIVNQALEFLSKNVKPEHLVFWEANCNQA